ncbi:ATP-dependent DNA helicase RecG [Micrococcales bacterium KH10]|nr:ATP-dependent DNA helicase RecG [Micrococcales bacterium KH10]
MTTSLVPFLDLKVDKVVSVPPATTDAEKQRAQLISQGLKGLPSMGIHTVRDALYYFPRRYIDQSENSDLAALEVDTEVTVLAEVLTLTQRRSRNGDKILTNVVLTDDNGATLDATFFARNTWSARYLESMLKPGTRALFSGKVGRYQGRRQLAGPDYELLDVGTEYAEQSLAHADDLVAIYRGKGKATSQAIRKVIRELLSQLPDLSDFEPLDQQMRTKYRLLPLGQALRQIHQPRERKEYRAARRRFRFEEALVLQTELARRRADAQTYRAEAWPLRDDGILAAFDERLPFELTDSQRKVGDELAAEIATETPMLRLVQGDVGAGKTVVAMRAMLQVVDGGGQAALLAPTEVLAAQHLRSVRALMGDLAAGGTLMAEANATKVTLLTGALGAKERKQALLDAASGQAGIVIGTHALLSDQVQFANLGLVVVDEQHRFGVEQRDVLRNRGELTPHTMVMTATPIPRTVAMTVFGDLAVSTLKQTPARRHPRATHVVPEGKEQWMARTWARLADEVKAGHRGFVVCNRISDTSIEEDTQTTSDEDAEPRILHTVEDTVARLSTLPALAGVRLAPLHGRMTPADKDATMAAFSAGEIDVVVSTTVIEVGVDVPEATIMVVLDADRFGISQLHQLRGRVGRGADPGICLLVSPVAPETLAGQRLAALEASEDGFALAETDLKLRHEGDVLGGAQSGFASSLRLLRVIDDADLIEQARSEAQHIVADDPQLAQHRVLAAAIAEMLAGREEFIERS